MSKITQAIRSVLSEHGYHAADYVAEGKLSDEIDAAVLKALEPPALTEGERERLAQEVRKTMTGVGVEDWGNCGEPGKDDYRKAATALYDDITSRHPVRDSALPLSDWEKVGLCEAAYNAGQKVWIHGPRWNHLGRKSKAEHLIFLDCIWTEFNKRTSISFAEVVSKLSEDYGFRIWLNGSGVMLDVDDEPVAPWGRTDDPATAVLNAIESLAPKPTEAEDNAVIAGYVVSANAITPTVFPDDVKAAFNRQKERQSDG